MDIHYIFCLYAIKAFYLYFKHIWNTNQTLLTALVQATILPRTHYCLVFLLLVLVLSCAHRILTSQEGMNPGFPMSWYGLPCENMNNYTCIFFLKGDKIYHLIESLYFCQLTGDKQSYRKEHVLFSMVFSQMIDTLMILINTAFSSTFSYIFFLKPNTNNIENSMLRNAHFFVQFSRIRLINKWGLFFKKISLSIILCLL